MSYPPVPASASTVDALLAHPWFAGVAPAALAPLAARPEAVPIVAGTDLFQYGEPVRTCLLVGAGELHGMRYSRAGDQKTLLLAGPGAVIGALSLFMHARRHPTVVRAVADGHGWLLDGDALRALSEATPSLMLHLLEACADKLAESMDRHDWFTSSSAEQRLADYLLRQRARQGRDDIALPLTRTQLAAKLGMRAETLSRLFAKWRQAHWVDDHGSHVTLQAPAQLRQLAEEGPGGH